MALSFEQEPNGDSIKTPVATNYTPIIPYTLYRDSSIASLFYYKLVLSVYTGTSEVAANIVAKFKQRRNNYSVDVAADKARAIFNIRDIVNTQLKNTYYDSWDSTIPYNPIWELGSAVTTKVFSPNNSQLLEFYVKGYEEYSSISGDTPTEETGDAVNDTKKYMSATIDLFRARGSDDFQDGPLEAFKLDSTSGRILTDVPTTPKPSKITNVLIPDNAKFITVRVEDYHCIAFFNGVDDMGSDPMRVSVIWFSGTIGIEANSYFNNDATAGGADPTTGTSLTTPKQLLYLGIGPRNLEEQTIQSSLKPSTNTTADGYIVTFWDNATSGGSQISEPLVFLIDYGINAIGQTCEQYNVVRLGWINSLGCWDFYNFTMKSTQKIDIEREEWESLLGAYHTDMYKYSNVDRGKETKKTKAKMETIINTDWIYEEEVPLFESLLKSTEVYIVNAKGAYYPLHTQDKLPRENQDLL